MGMMEITKKLGNFPLKSRRDTNTDIHCLIKDREVNIYMNTRFIHLLLFSVLFVSESSSSLLSTHTYIQPLPFPSLSSNPTSNHQYLLRLLTQSTIKNLNCSQLHNLNSTQSYSPHKPHKQPQQWFTSPKSLAMIRLLLPSSKG